RTLLLRLGASLQVSLEPDQTDYRASVYPASRCPRRSQSFRQVRMAAVGLLLRPALVGLLLLPDAFPPPLPPPLPRHIQSLHPLPPPYFLAGTRRAAAPRIANSHMIINASR